MMRRIIAIVFCFSLLCTGCAGTMGSLKETMATAYSGIIEMMFGSYQNESAVWMEQALDAIANERSEDLLGLFSEEVIRDIVDVDAQIGELFAYFEGEVLSTQITYGMVSKSNHGGIYEEAEVGCDVITTSGSYRILLQVCLQNERYQNDVGILSLIIVESEMIPTDTGYWGAYRFTPGILIYKA